MPSIGYALSSEEHAPNDLIRNARSAEQAGFEFALISDHYHPWVAKQGQSPFVWSVIGGIAQATQRLRLGTGVTCPTIRMHPAIIAQAAATCAAMMPGRFFLGVGTGENLNEHILGDRWPPHDQRLAMLEEAIAVIRLLWSGGEQTYRGRFYTIENAQLFTLPDAPTPIMVAASATHAAQAAGRIGDGLISTKPDAKIIQAFQAEGGATKPRYGQLTVCWGPNEARARRVAHEIWPNAGLTGELSQELATPDHFEQTVKLVTEEQIAEKIVCGPDPKRHIAAIRSYIDAGFDSIYVHQVGPDQGGFFAFYADEVLPTFR